MVARVAALLSIAVLANAITHPRRCLFYQGVCVSHCPRLMHPYHTRCDRNTMSQRTCNAPQIRRIGYTCGWSRCDCNGQLLYDEYQGSCVPLDDCITFRKQKLHKHRPRKKFRLSKRLKLKEYDEMLDEPRVSR